MTWECHCRICGRMFDLDEPDSGRFYITHDRVPICIGCIDDIVLGHLEGRPSEIKPLGSEGDCYERMLQKVS